MQIDKEVNVSDFLIIEIALTETMNNFFFNFH